MFEQFTERARHVLMLAQEEGRALRHNYLGTEHILLGLLREEEGVAARVLESFGVTLEGARARVARIVGPGDEEVTGQVPFTPRSKKVLEFALREALSLGHDYIGTEHLLLGLTRENEGVGFRVLLDFDVYGEEVRDAVIRFLAGPGRRQTDESFPPGEESRVELVLRRVLPVAQQMTDGSWVVSVEVWDHGLVLRWATSGRPPPSARRTPYNRDWLVSDDVGTSYDLGRWNTGGGNPQAGFQYFTEFLPAPPAEATLLRIRREPADEELSISLTD